MTRVDQLTGRLVRRCTNCGAWKDQETCFNRREKPRDGQRQLYRSLCRVCEAASKRRRRRERSGDIIGTLPAKPLADAIDMLIRRREAGNLWDSLPPVEHDQNGQREHVCRELGTHARRLSDWRTGRANRVQFDVADRIISRGPWCWWDVWNETTVDADELARVTELFEGQVAA